MKKLLLLLIVYGNMGFIASDHSLRERNFKAKPLPSSFVEPSGILVHSPDTYRIVMN